MSIISKRSASGRSTSRGGYETVAVRFARQEDALAIYRVAALDDKEAPTGRVLVAEADGQVIAALPLNGGEPVADPFRWTSDLVALMQMRAEQLQGPETVSVPATGGAVRTVRMV